ncbi:MAG: rhomboid family intramembrane serine protease [Halioglobus sp.]|nr:rhomboid family intramembrane serine protease [Halioglobus sp.]
MTDFYPALNVAVEEDLLPLSALLQQRGVLHRIFEESGQQVVMVANAEQAPQVQELYRAWRAGEVRIELSPRQPVARPSSTVTLWHRAPVTLALVVLSICGFLLVYLHAPLSWVSYLTFTPVRITGNQLLFDSINGQYWRLVTPAFLHFGVLHIVFNCLWLWELGGRVERVLGHFNMFMLFLVIAVVSNASQFAFDGASLFGGMSGVVYGLLGFSWVAPHLQPLWNIQPSRSIMLLMVGWLLACILGVVEVLGFGAIANAAHVGGLLIGALLGAVFGAFSKYNHSP